MNVPSLAVVLHGLTFLFSYKSPPSRLRPTAWLDGLRGIAAFEVVVYHYAELWGGIDIGYGSRGKESETLLRLPMIRSIYDSGAAMVCLFFVISGFVLTQRVLRAFQKRDLGEAFGVLSSSIFRRGLRLFPPAVASAFIAFLLFQFFEIRPYGAHPSGVPYYDSFFRQLHHWIVETIRYVNPFESNLKDAFSIVHGQVRFLGHSYANVIWTIPVEYYGSMACYMELVGTAKLPTRTRNVIIALISLWAVLVSRWILFCFNAGILLAEWLLHQSLTPATQQKRSATTWWSAVLVAGIYLAGSPDHGPGPGYNPSLGFNTVWYIIPESYTGLDFNYTVWSVAGILIAASASQLAYARRFLESGICQYLGKVSFSVYLLHVIVRDAIGYSLQTFLLKEAQGKYSTGGAETDTEEASSHESWVARYCICVLWFCIMLPVVFIVSGVFERFVDAPLIRMSKWAEHWAVNSAKQGYEPIEPSIELEMAREERAAADREGDLP